MRLQEMIEQRNITIPLKGFVNTEVDPDAMLIAWSGYVFIVRRSETEQQTSEDLYSPFPTLS